MPTSLYLSPCVYFQCLFFPVYPLFCPCDNSGMRPESIHRYISCFSQYLYICFCPPCLCVILFPHLCLKSVSVLFWLVPPVLSHLCLVTPPPPPPPCRCHLCCNFIGCVPLLVFDLFLWSCDFEPLAWIFWSILAAVNLDVIIQKNKPIEKTKQGMGQCFQDCRCFRI